MEGLSRSNLAAGAVAYFLRLVQITNISISCFGVCFLVYMHDNYVCSYYPCPIAKSQAPMSEVIFIITCVVVGLEFVYSSATTIWTLKLNRRPESFSPLCAACLSVAVSLLGLVAFASNPHVRETWPFCYGIWPGRDQSVEKMFCIVTQSSVTCGLIAWVATLFIAVLALREFRLDYLHGVLRLKDGQEEASESGAAVAIEDIAVPAS